MVNILQTTSPEKSAQNEQDSTVVFSAEANEIWKQAQATLQTQMAKNDYYPLFGQTQLIINDGLYKIQAPNEQIKDILENRQTLNIKRALAGVVGEPVEVMFAIAEDKDFRASKSDKVSSTKRIVLEVGSLNFEGNIIPASWFEHLRYKSGKPHTNAIIILSEIVYWYRPVEVRDERSGRVIGYRKKFEADKLQRSYQSFATQFGFTKKQARDAISFLVEQGVITKELRNIKTKDGTPLSNVLYLEVVPEQLKKITYPRNLEDSYDLQVTPSDL